jgi:hypothetical protein
MGLRKNTAPARKPHPNPLIELHLQRILGCLQAIGRYELLIEEYRDQMSAASDEQDRASYTARTTQTGRAAYDAVTIAQERRMAFAQAGIAEAEQAIAAQREEAAKLAAEMAESDLAYL